MFPYSRHSSYKELCHLISAFRPLDVFPCTFDAQSRSEEESIETLFGRYCSGNTFSYDLMIRSSERRAKDKVTVRNSPDEKDFRQDCQQSGEGHYGPEQNTMPSILASPSSTGYNISPQGMPALKRRRLSTASNNVGSRTAIEASPSIDVNIPRATSKSHIPKAELKKGDDVKLDRHKAGICDSTETCSGGIHAERGNDVCSGIGYPRTELAGKVPQHSREELAIGDDGLAGIADEGSPISVTDSNFESQTSLTGMEFDLLALSRRKEAYTAARDYIRYAVPLEQTLTISSSGHREEEVEL